MIKNFFRRLYNIRLVITLIIFLVTLGVCLIFSHTIKKIYVDYRENQLVSGISAYASRISNQLIVTDYLTSTNRTLNNELDVAAELYGGRIIVTDASLNVVYDTYSRAIGKTAVLKEILSAANGNNVSKFDWDTHYGVYSCGVTAGGDSKIRGCMYFVFSIDDEANMIAEFNKKTDIITALLSISVLVIGFVSLLLIMKPLKSLKKSMKKISSGDFTTKVEPSGMWEFREYANSANEMLKKVRSTEESQQAFVSDVSHELKTPMASMKVLADSLLMQEIDDVEIYREFMKDIDETIDRENNIIQDLLTIVKMDKKSDKLAVSKCSMNELLSIVLKRVTPLAKKSGIEVIYESYREVIAEVDENKLVMALTNFVENGVKYNKEMGQVRVSLNSDGNYAYINIEDTGVGIPADAISHIFDRFYRVDKARDRETGGTGLGLSIAYEVIKMHNGDIKVSSKEGEGTLFSIRLPLYHKNTSGSITVTNS